VTNSERIKNQDKKLKIKDRNDRGQKLFIHQAQKPKSVNQPDVLLIACFVFSAEQTV